MANPTTQRGVVVTTVEQENFATWKFHKFGAKAIRVQDIFVIFLKVEVLSFHNFLMRVYNGNIRMQEIVANPRKIPAHENFLFYSIHFYCRIMESYTVFVMNFSTMKKSTYRDFISSFR